MKMIRIRLYLAIFGVFLLYTFIHEFYYRQYERDDSIGVTAPIDSSANYNEAQRLITDVIDTVPGKDTAGVER